MKNVYELIPDVNDLFKNGVDTKVTGLDEVVSSRLKKNEHPNTYRMSNHGWPDRKLWYHVNRPETQEELRPEVKFKFLYGDILETLILVLAEATGHTVEGKQDERQIAGLKGHIDCIIDGMLIDVKSANTRAFSKWRDGSFLSTDPFGYIDQLHLYLAASQDDPRVTFKKEAGWLVIDKELGHIVLRTIKFQDRNFVAEINRKREMLARTDPPPRCYPEKDYPMGNKGLDVQCSYCPHKKECWPTLRTFIYSNGPAFLTRVNKVPNVPEA